MKNLDLKNRILLISSLIFNIVLVIIFISLFLLSYPLKDKGKITNIKIDPTSNDYSLLVRDISTKEEQHYFEGQISISVTGKKYLLFDGDDGLYKRFIQTSPDHKFISYWDSISDNSDWDYKLKIYDIEEGLFFNSDMDTKGIKHYLPDTIFPQVYCSSWTNNIYTFAVKDVGYPTYPSNDIVFYTFEPITNQNFDGVDTLVHGKEIILPSGESGANLGKDTFQISPECKYIAYFESFPTNVSLKNSSSGSLDIVVTQFTIEDPFNYRKWTFDIPQVPLDHFSFEWISETEVNLNENKNKVKILYNDIKKDFVIDLLQNNK